MRILYIGSVEFSQRALEHLISLRADIVGICTTKSSKENSDFADLTVIASRSNIPCKQVDDINSDDALQWMRALAPDIIFCFGWSRLLGDNLLKLANMGVVGFHPTLLPANRGRHPIIWALALGLKETGSTFFFMDSGADSGDILSQKEVSIQDSDTARILYDRICMVALDQIAEFLPALISNNYQRITQDLSAANSWRKRSIRDGLIDWRMSATAIYNLVRALSAPYPGALMSYQSKDIKVLEVEIIPGKIDGDEPGKVVGVKNGKPIIKCGTDSICLSSAFPVLDLNIGDYV